MFFLGSSLHLLEKHESAFDYAKHIKQATLMQTKRFFFFTLNASFFSTWSALFFFSNDLSLFFRNI